MTEEEREILRLCAKGLTSTLRNGEYDKLLEFSRGPEDEVSVGGVRTLQAKVLDAQ